MNQITIAFSQVNLKLKAIEASFTSPAVVKKLKPNTKATIKITNNVCFIFIFGGGAL